MILSVCLLLFVAPSPTPVAGSGQNATVPYSITISTDQPVVKAGSKIPLHIVETNTSNDIFQWDGARVDSDNDNGLNYKVYVFDDKGALASQTEWGAYIVSGRQPRGRDLAYASSSMWIDLPPGGTIKRAVLIDALYNLNSGKYTIQVQREEQNIRLVPKTEAELEQKTDDLNSKYHYKVQREPGTFLLKSNIITITVTP